MQPAVLADFGGSLSETVRARVPEAVDIAVAELASWGYACTPRAQPPAERLNAASLSLQAYESGRPSEQEACRVGDARFLASHAEETR